MKAFAQSVLFTSGVRVFLCGRKTLCDHFAAVRQDLVQLGADLHRQAQFSHEPINFLGRLQLRAIVMRHFHLRPLVNMAPLRFVVSSGTAVKYVIGFGNQADLLVNRIEAGVGFGGCYESCGEVSCGCEQAGIERRVNLDMTGDPIGSGWVGFDFESR